MAYELKCDFDELTEEEYVKLLTEGEAVFETPAEYGDYAAVVPAKKPDGTKVWLGIKWQKRSLGNPFL